jgi:methylenetetrahydrofolate reductase (NADH)
VASYARLLEHPRYEVLPTPSAEELVASSVPSGVVVTVTSSPSKGLEATIDLAERLRARGYAVVPHLAARQVVDAAHLAEVVERLSAAGVTDVFVPAGDNALPAGAYEG